MKLTNKVAVITGAGRGIGRSIAKAYVQEGAKLAICARTRGEVEQTAAELGSACFASTCDVSREDSVEAFVTAVLRELGSIDVLINNAGVMTRPVPFQNIEIPKWDYTIAVNLRGPFLMTRALLPAMLQQKRGSIINVSSMIGRTGYANFGAYATAKWGLEGLTQTLAAELRNQGIRVNSVDPGYVATKLTGYRGSQPDSVTDVFVYLGSDEARNVTGRALSSSGWRSEVRL